MCVLQINMHVYISISRYNTHPHTYLVKYDHS